MSKTFKTMDNLQITWAVSRGRDTYGYNICRADSYVMGKRYRTCGGGYDMVGTVVGHYIQDRFQEQLKALIKTHASELTVYGSTKWMKIDRFYGLTVNPANDAVSLDGACGVECMLKIAGALGLEVQRTGNKKGHTTGFIFCEVSPE